MPGAPDTTIDTVRMLIAEQFPHWRHLPVEPVDPGGWDNRTFRLGTDMAVRIPSAKGYAAQVEKEQRWLPELARHLPLQIPAPIAVGQPSESIPWSWSVNRWIEGETATFDRMNDPVEFAEDVAQFLHALCNIDASNGPAAGPHNFFRGGPLSVYDAETRNAIRLLGHKIDGRRTLQLWKMGLNSKWTDPPVWVHGDIAAGNLILRDGRLAAVIDFGSSGVGDPACDLAIAWTLFEGDSRATFRGATGAKDDLWVRGMCWALWKSLIVLAGMTGHGAGEVQAQERILERILADEYPG